jgi:hypothetical protein
MPQRRALLSRVGADALEDALVEVLEHDAIHIGAVRQVLDKRRSDRGLPPPVTIPLAPASAIEQRECQKRGLERRTRDAHVGAAKPMADFDWAWPRKIDRQALEELFTLACIETGHKLPPQRGQGTHRRPRQAANQETPTFSS